MVQRGLQDQMLILSYSPDFKSDQFSYTYHLHYNSRAPRILQSGHLTSLKCYYAERVRMLLRLWSSSWLYYYLLAVPHCQ